MTRMAGSVKGITEFLGVKPEYGAMGSEAIGRAAQEISKVTLGNALATNAGLKATADIQSAQHYADAKVAMGQAAGQQALVGGITDGIMGFAKGQMGTGGIFNKGGGAGSSLGTKASDYNLSGLVFS